MEMDTGPYEFKIYATYTLVPILEYGPCPGDVDGIHHLDRDGNCEGCSLHMTIQHPVKLGVVTGL